MSRKSDLDDIADLREEMKLMAELEKQFAPPTPQPTERHPLPAFTLAPEHQEAQLFELLWTAATMNRIEFDRNGDEVGEFFRNALTEYVKQTLDQYESPIERLLASQFLWSHIRASQLMTKSAHIDRERGSWQAAVAINTEAARLMNLCRRQAETLADLKAAKQPKQPDIHQVIQVAVVAVLQLMGGDPKKLTYELIGDADVKHISTVATRAAIDAGVDPEAQTLASLNGAANETGKGSEPVERTSSRAPKPGTRGSKAKRKGGATRRKAGAK